MPLERIHKLTSDKITLGRDASCIQTESETRQKMKQPPLGEEEGTREAGEAREKRRDNMVATNRLLSTLLLLASATNVAEGGIFKKKHRRTKAGTKYSEHDAVHVVVNKVG